MQDDIGYGCTLHTSIRLLLRYADMQIKGCPRPPDCCWLLLLLLRIAFLPEEYKRQGLISANFLAPPTPRPTQPAKRGPGTECAVGPPSAYRLLTPSFSVSQHPKYHSLPQDYLCVSAQIPATMQYTQKAGRRCCVIACAAALHV